MIFRKKKTEKAKYWKDCSIPANLFFHNTESETLDFLVISGNPTEEELKKAWQDIEDEYYLLVKNKKSEIQRDTRLKAMVLKLKINQVKNAINIIAIMPVTVDQAEQVIEKLKPLGIKFKSGLTTNQKIDVITKQYIPSWETDLEIELQNIKENDKSVSYEESVQWISDVKGRHIPEEMSLRRFVTEEKSAIKYAKLRLKNAS